MLTDDIGSHGTEALSGRVAIGGRWQSPGALQHSGSGREGHHPRGPRRSHQGGQERPMVRASPEVGRGQHGPVKSG